jgi:uncharacterized SAM-binding protein YcdF (DUF218 family)
LLVVRLLIILKSKKQIVLLLLIAVVAALALLPSLAWGAARLLIVRTPAAHAEAIVMLSGSATFHERAQHAAQLYKEGRAAKIILTNDNLESGWSEKEQRNPFYYERARAQLIQSGVPEQNIEVLMNPILGTYDEACTIKLYCESHNLHSLIVVTSGYHSRRALFTFRKVFSGSQMEVGMDPVAPGIDTPSPATWWYKSFGWQVVGQEYGKLLCYRLNLQ